MLVANKPLGSIGYIGSPHSVPEPWAWSFANAVLFAQQWLCPPGTELHLLRGNDNGQADMRNHLSRSFLGDWLIQVDTDHTFDADLFVRLVTTANNNGFDVLTGLYQKRVPPFAPVTYRLQGTRLTYFVPGDFDGFPGGPAKAYSIDGAGTGCLFVRRSVFDRITNELQELPFEPLPVEDLPGKVYSEDFSFFTRLRRLNPPVPVWCVPSIQANHLNYGPVLWSDFDRELLLAGTEPSTGVNIAKYDW